MQTNSDAVTIIDSKPRWAFIDFNELFNYKDLIFFLVWREIKVLYAQTILGFFWAILQPLIQIVLFTIVFGKIAKISTDGTPYFLFSTVAIIPWTYMSQAMSQSSESLVKDQNMLGKIYFPRIVFPMTPVLARLVDFTISILIVLCVMIYYQVPPSWNLVYFPLFLVMMTIIPLSIGLWLSALAIRFRDIKFAMPFVVRMLIYSAPIVYSSSSIPGAYRLLYSFNPIVGVIEGYRACLLGTSMPWAYIWPGSVTAVILLLSGAMYFKRMERIFADVI